VVSRTLETFPERSGITTENRERALNTLRANALLVG